ncbi:MAG: T9SS type A sorting domain-containing protein, partial [Saprospiraceae bacterium]|nr:T9SS type A sorting domain-containing protein [Saprospiraceae bacterium]
YFADWCTGQNAGDGWWQDNSSVMDTFVQSITVMDPVNPECVITMNNAISGSGAEQDPGLLEASGGCTVAGRFVLELSDACGLHSLSWQVFDLKSSAVELSGEATLQDTTALSYALDISDLSPGSYLLQSRVIDQCQNENYCDYYFDAVAGKKPGPVCFTDMTVELQAWDSDQDGEIDTASNVLHADQLESSSLPPCGEEYASLSFKIEWMDTADPVYDPGRVSDSLDIGCNRAGGTHRARLWVVSQSGTADFCDVNIRVLDKNNACSDGSSNASSGPNQTAALDIGSGVGFRLYQNRPNPFNGETTIGFRLPEAMHAQITVYDVSGRVIRTYEGDYAKGYNQITVDQSQLATKGILYYQLDTEQFTATRRMILIE